MNTDSSPSFLVPVKLTFPPATNRSIQILTPHGYSIRLNAGFTMTKVSELIEGTLDRGDTC